MSSSLELDFPAVDQTLCESIQYQGRKASRVKSEQRRREILQAALRIVAKEGVQGVKHRAVAKEAGVPLASTTYYFKDINELITDAFMLFAEKSREKLEFFYSELRRLADVYDAASVMEDEGRKREFANALVEMGTNYVLGQVRHHKSELMSEQAFLMESVRDESLSALARRYKDAWLSGLVDFMQSLGYETYIEDAAIIMGMVGNLEQEGALQGGSIDEDKVRRVWRRLLYMMLDIR
ncbi:TetR family transcriptional regulator [Hahella sp. KA22]|uniref:TetR/AcrR family transcriptional regulator n=1 Tax=Hahella sp. KA22 TaxID=1628392 RepID=UPI000FDD7268|nr:TetR family transcriptional regulator [Hahella sp. KA22]AZZ91338.1 TetR family transcriptional regulator [Hahella sp. KA22]QAY54708.1 TetR family transcriptional regulator [Hahella sp. KA22]